MLFQDDMVFYDFGEMLRYNLPEIISKPLFDCLTCMTVIWGVPIYLFFDSQPELWTAIQFVGALGGSNAIIHSMLNMFICIKDFLNGYYDKP